MSYQAIDLTAGKVYMTGRTKAECLRKLNDKYPYVTSKRKIVQTDYVLPEPLKVV